MCVSYQSTKNSFLICIHEYIHLFLKESKKWLNFHCNTIQMIMKISQQKKLSEITNLDSISQLTMNLVIFFTLQIKILTVVYEVNKFLNHYAALKQAKMLKSKECQTGVEVWTIITSILFRQTCLIRYHYHPLTGNNRCKETFNNLRKITILKNPASAQPNP